MSYDKEVIKKLGGRADVFSDLYRITLAKNYAVVEGHKGVLYFGEDKIVLRLKSGSVALEGKGLNIADSQKDETVIKGRVFSVVFEEEKA